MLSNRINNLSESETLAMSRKSRELKALGHDVINLSLGEPDFNTPDFIKKAAKKAIDENYTLYTPVAGYQDLRQAICEKFKRDNNLDYTPEQIVVSTGAKQSLANIIMSIINPGDEVIVPKPYWVTYPALVSLAEGKSVFISTKIENDFKVTAKEISAAITPRTKAIMYSSPCNPSGSVYTKDELKQIAEVIAKHKNIIIIADEIYEHINFVGKHESVAQFDFIKEQVITVNGVSKGFAMTGWRLGYIGAPIEIAKACDKYQGQITSGTCSISQRAAMEAVKANPSGLTEMKEMLAAFKERRDLVLKLLGEIKGIKTNVPQGAFYVLPDVSCYYGKSDGKTIVNNAGDLCMYLINKAFVALVPGDAFGDANCIRLSYATSKEMLTKAIKRIKDALEQLS